MVSPTPILFPAAFECRRHLTKGGRERGVGDKRGVVFTWRETDDATAANERKSITRCRPPPPRLHASAPPPSAFPFSRARVFSRFLLADWQRPARGSSFLVETGILELRLFSFSRASGGSYRQIFFFSPVNSHLRYRYWRSWGQFKWVDPWSYLESTESVEKEDGGRMYTLVRRWWFINNSMQILYRRIYIVHVERKYRTALCIFFVSRNQWNSHIGMDIEYSEFHGWKVNMISLHYHEYGGERSLASTPLLCNRLKLSDTYYSLARHWRIKLSWISLVA